MAETIDNLPLGNNNRWAQDQEALASAPAIKEDRFVVGPARADVTEPAYLSQISAFTGQDQVNVRWALIEPPAIYGAKTNLFTEDLIPRMGNNEKLEILKDRLKSLPKTPHGE